MERCEDCNQLDDVIGTWDKGGPNEREICEDCAEGRMIDISNGERF